MAFSIDPQQLLNRHNYSSWSRHIKRVLETEGLSVWIDKSKWPLEDQLTPIDKFKLSQSKSRAAGILKTYCSPEVELIVGHLDDPAVIWDTLQQNLEIPGRSLKSFYINEFRNLRIGPEEDLPTFVSRFETCYRKVEEMGETVSESHRCYQLLQCLPEDYDYLVRELDNLPEDKFTFSNVKNEILKEFSRRDYREKQKQESLMSSVKREPENVTKPKYVSKPKFKCSKCGRTGHLARFCRSKPSRSREEVGTFISELIGENDCYLNENLSLSWDWVLDSASTSHVCQNKHFFTKLKNPPPGAVVKMGTTPHVVEGIGDVSFNISDQGKICTVNLINVLYVPSIHKNLISMSKMDKAGIHAKMDKGFKIFSQNWKYMYTARPRNNFFVLKAIRPMQLESDKPHDVAHFCQNREMQASAFSSAFYEQRNHIMLWHERLGHCNFDTLKRMFNENLVDYTGTLQGKETMCEACILSKNTRASHPRLREIRSTNLLDLVHSDVWGPSPVTSKAGYRYILTFVDDFSRRAFCYPLRTKNEVFGRMKTFITFVERQTGRKVKVIRTDNGLEFCCHSTEKLLTSLGIRHERTSTYSPQMNGCAERYNRVLFEGMRTLMQAGNIPQNLWVEAVMTTNYLRNRILHTTTGTTPFHRWYGRKPSIRHLKRYGCLAYVHQPKLKRNKLQPRAKQGIFVGYGLRSSGYRIWFPNEDSIIESKHVTFNESILGKQETKIQLRFHTDDDELTGTKRHVIPDIMMEEPPVDKPGTSLMPTECEEELNQEEPLPVPDEDEPAPEATYTFYRYCSLRQKGASKGKTDVYILAPCGKKLRSTKDLSEYCSTHNIVCNDIRANFSTLDPYEGPITLQSLPIINDTPNNETLCTELIIPRTAAQAKLLPEAHEWKQAMDKEISTMEDRKVWTLVPREDTQKVIGTRWVYTMKHINEKGKGTFKARLVALGNNQLEGLDYEETFSPVVNFTLIRLFIILFISILGWSHCLLDVKCAYLYGDIDKPIFIRQPTDYVVEGKETHVLKLNKAIYGLHQSGRCWYNELHNKLLRHGFQEIQGLTCIYQFKNKAVIQVYVDDIPVYAKDKETLMEVVGLLSSIYDVKNLGPITSILGLEMKTKNGRLINFNCEKYILKCLDKFNVIACTNVCLPITPGTVPSFHEKPQTEEEEKAMEKVPYRSLLGSLLYIANKCRPDISFSVACLSQFCENPGPAHWRRLLQILKYIASTKSLGLKLSAIDSPLQMTAFADASWASDPSDRKSWTGYSIFLNECPVTWRVIKQTCVALSPMESEFISASECSKDLKYLDNTLRNLCSTFPLEFAHVPYQKPLLFGDNLAAIQYIKHKAENIKNRYIDLKYKFIQDLYQRGSFDVFHVSTKDNVADLLTKALCKDSFLKFRTSYLC